MSFEPARGAPTIRSVYPSVFMSPAEATDWPKPSRLRSPVRTMGSRPPGPPKYRYARRTPAPFVRIVERGRHQQIVESVAVHVAQRERGAEPVRRIRPSRFGPRRHPGPAPRGRCSGQFLQERLPDDEILEAIPVEVARRADGGSEVVVHPRTREDEIRRKSQDASEVDVRVPRPWAVLLSRRAVRSRPRIHPRSSRRRKPPMRRSPCRTVTV